MTKTQIFIEKLRETALSGPNRKITGRNLLIKNLFSFLFKRTRLEYRLLVLCTKKGMILDCFSADFQEDLTGFSAPPDFFKPYQDILSFGENAEEFSLIAILPQESAAAINQLQSNLKMLLNIFDAGKNQEQYLLNCLNALDNAICIYDKDASLLFGNKTYFENMQIFDQEAVIGMNIQDITKQEKIKIHAKKNNSNNLKMLDVLKTGKKVLDWEVMIESQTSPSKAQVTSNNMYPIRNKSGKIEGMIEISSSHQMSLDKTKKLMGLTAEYTFDSIIGESPAIQHAVEEAKEYAASSYNLLIVGESGVGKELFAQAIHNYSGRKYEPFVALNCASFPENLIESELFGYVGGAFTGASKSGQIGKFELADGGTLFLDEIGELPFHFQSKLLRVLETHKITRIGSSTQTPINVRVIAATNRDLEKMIEEGMFRKDLYYRLQVLNIEIPPLRERKNDLLLLTDAFFRQAADNSGGEPKHLEPGAQRALMEYTWPGNVRELRNVIQRVSLLSKTETVTKPVLESAISSKGYALKAHTGGESPQVRLNKRIAGVNAAYAELIEEALEIAEGNKSHAAELIGVSRMTFYRMMDKYLKQ